MCDITLCNSVKDSIECELRNDCNRYLWSLDYNKVNNDYQSYFVEAPFEVVDNEFECEYLIKK